MGGPNLVGGVGGGGGGGVQLLRWILLHVGWEWLRDLRCGGGTDHGNARRTGAAGNSQGSVAAIAAAAPRHSTDRLLPLPP